MKIAIITGSAGLIGSQSVMFLSPHFHLIIGIDNNFRQYFFGKEASTQSKNTDLLNRCHNYLHKNIDIRNFNEMKKIFTEYGSDITLIIHSAAQPSHDWAAKDPITDFSVNANGTLNLLELARNYCHEAIFIYTSTNKVYGDRPNLLPIEECETRWEIDKNHPYFERGIDESMSIDNSKHSLFGVSKTAADLLAQEYGKYFGMKVGVFRCGCLTGPNHSGTELHGFLSYLIKCAVKKIPYTIHGYKGKQVRDNLHSSDLVNMFWCFYQNPRKGEVYNIGGGRHSNCSVIEALKIAEEIFGEKINYTYAETNRVGDHIWWISDISKFQQHFPSWNYSYTLEKIIEELISHYNT